MCKPRWMRRRIIALIYEMRFVVVAAAADTTSSWAVGIRNPLWDLHSPTLFAFLTGYSLSPAPRSVPCVRWCIVMWAGVPDVVNNAKFHQNRFSGFGSLRGRNLPFSYAGRYGLYNHRRSQGVQWVHLHPPGRWRKFFSGLIYRKNV